MKLISPDFKAHLEGEVTTICRCWIINRTDGQRLGFTDHDEDVTIDGVVCEKRAGMEASGIEERLGLNADTADIASALQSDRITAEEIDAGNYDAGRVQIFVVNWASPSQFFLDRVLIIGEITRRDGAFAFELRGLSSQIDQTAGRHFVRRCQADLGDNKCAVNTALSTYTTVASVSSSASASVFSTSGLTGYQDGWFSQGKLEWLTGANAGKRMEVSEHGKNGSSASIVLWQGMPAQISAGDQFRITAGCDKAFSTCKSKFANQINFQGFPHMPGDGFASRHAATSEQMDGGPIIP